MKTKRSLIYVAMIIFTFFIGMQFVTVKAQKNDNNGLKKEYISVTINDGDTLWSIANDNFGIGYSDVNDYVEDIKSVNGISSDTIHEGNNIIIPRYVVDESIN